MNLKLNLKNLHFAISRVLFCCPKGEKNMAIPPTWIKINGEKLTIEQCAKKFGISETKVKEVHDRWHGKWIYAPKEKKYE